MKRRLDILVTLLAALCSSASAQNAAPTDIAAGATVTFDVFWEAATPQAYTISVKSTGETKYVSRNPTKAPDENGVRDADYELQFTISAANRERVFAWAQQAGYFDGNFDYKHKVADTGKKTLSYSDSTRHFATTYNWSANAPIDQLTRLFQGISSTIEHGRKVQFLRRFDKLGLEAELKAMEEMAGDHFLCELQVIAPILENIANDSAVLNIARQRARRLLARSLQDGADAVKAVK